MQKIRSYLIMFFILAVFVMPGTAGAIDYPFMDDMEAGSANWSAESSWAQTQSDAHSPVTDWTDSDGTYYANNADLSLASPLDLSTAKSPKFTFRHWFQLEASFDYGYVEVSRDRGVNLIEDGSLPGVITGDPGLDSLQDNGGVTLTHLPLEGSLTIDAADNREIPVDSLDMDGDGDTDELIPYDQRSFGFPRISNGTVNIGAVELKAIEDFCDYDRDGDGSDLFSYQSGLIAADLSEFAWQFGTINE
jgi:hypothetical protein